MSEGWNLEIGEQHLKNDDGEKVIIVAFARHETTNEPIVVYKPLNGGNSGGCRYLSWATFVMRFSPDSSPSGTNLNVPIALQRQMGLVVVEEPTL